MISGRLKTILLVSLIAAFVTIPAVLAQQRPRRVFTNEDVVRTPPPAPAPAAPATPAATPATPAEGTPDAASAPATPGAAAEPAANLPQGLALAQPLQEVLQRYHTEIALKLEQEVDAGRQERWRNLMNLAIRLIVQNQMYIAELQAQQPQQSEGQSPSQSQAPAGAPSPAP